MSTVYVLEPPTKGKVILTMSYGALDIELWPKEAPKAVRNFVQLCLEGYYNHTIFHGIVKSFLVQGGDPTGTGEGGKSTYGDDFADEFHSRLRFKHKGLVGCAGSGTPNSNGSQFFITLDRCDWLDKKHTIFGKVTGDSIYNLLHLGEVETGKDDRPWDPPPKILSVEVLWNPFNDIVPRTIPAKALPTSEKKETKEKVTKKLNLLSFGEEDGKDIAAVNARIKSSHDVLDDPRLLKEEGLENDLKSDEVQKRKDALSTVREALRSKRKHRKELETGISESLDYSDDDEASFDARMRQQILRRRTELGDVPTKKDMPIGSRNHVESPSRYDNVNVRAERMGNADADLQFLDAAERQLKKQKKRRRRQGQENEMLATLEKFKSSVFSTKSNARRKDDDDDVSDWMQAMLKFALQNNNMCRGNDPNEYVVHDPLLENGKAKFNKMQAKIKRRQREWAGRSLT